MNVLQHAQMQKSDAPPHQNSFNIRLRKAMRIRIYAILRRRQPSKTCDASSRAKLIYITKLLENKLMTSAKSEKEYSDLRDLQVRMDSILRQIKRLISQRRAASTPSSSMRNANSCCSSNLYRVVTPSGSLPVSQDTILLNPNPTLRVESNQARDMEKQGKHMEPKAVYNCCSSERAPISCSQIVSPRSNTEECSSKEVVKGDCGRHCMTQKKWLRFLLHALRCNEAEGKCGKECFIMRRIIKNRQSCKPPRSILS